MIVLQGLIDPGNWSPKGRYTPVISFPRKHTVSLIVKNLSDPLSKSGTGWILLNLPMTRTNYWNEPVSGLFAEGEEADQRIPMLPGMPLKAFQALVQQEQSIFHLIRLDFRTLNRSTPDHYYLPPHHTYRSL